VGARVYRETKLRVNSTTEDDKRIRAAKETAGLKRDFSGMFEGVAVISGWYPCRVPIENGVTSLS
jgi:hypothetical protein